MLFRSALEGLYAGKPVGSVAIGEACRMEHPQVLKYLHAAEAAGQVRAAYARPGGAIRGWIPANAPTAETLADGHAKQVATAVLTLLRSGKRVTISRVARHLDIPVATAGRWLRYAESTGLVSQDAEGGWKPA